MIEGLKALNKLASGLVDIIEIDKHGLPHWILTGSRGKNYLIVKKELKTLKELDKHLDFSDGALMSGFNYKGQQIVAMPLKEYDKHMKKDQALEIIKLVLGFGTNRAIIKQAYKTGWITEEQFNLLKEESLWKEESL